MMRAPHLAALAGAAALLSACGVTTNGGIRPVGGDVFVLETSGLSGSRAVESGLDEAQRFCAQNGRQFTVQNSRVGSGLYQLEFRCLSPMGLAGRRDPLLTAAATPVATSVTDEAPRRRIRRRAPAAVAADAAYAPEPAAAPAEAAPRPVRRVRRARPADDQAAYGGGGLQPIAPAPAYARSFAAAPAPAQPPALPPVATTPLFAPPPGTNFPAPATAVRRIPADNSPFAPIETQAQPVAAPVAQQQRAPVAQPRGLPVIPVQPAAMQQTQPQADSLPPIQVTPVVASPAAAGTAWVPSQQPLPGASSSLPPIAGSARPSPVSTNVAPQGFFSGR